MVRGSPRWVVELGPWNGPGRKRQFFKSLADAEAAAKAAAKHREELGKRWAALAPREKIELLQARDQAQEAGWTLEELAAKAGHRTAPANRTLGKAIDELLLAKEEAKRSKTHLRNLRQYLRTFARGREATDIADIHEGDIREWFRGRGESDIAMRDHRALLSALFEHCWRRRYIAENPVRRLDPIRLDAKVPAVLALDQCRRALDWCQTHEPQFLGWLALTLFCGLRPESEADHVSWRDVDRRRGRIVLTRTKTRRPRILELDFCPPALRWLRMAKRLKARLPLPRMTRIRCLRRLRAHLGLAKWPQDILRHTAASNLLAFHGEAGKVALWSGNSERVLLRAYKGLIFREDAAKWMRL